MVAMLVLDSFSCSPESKGIDVPRTISEECVCGAYFERVASCIGYQADHLELQLSCDVPVLLNVFGQPACPNLIESCRRHAHILSR